MQKNSIQCRRYNEDIELENEKDGIDDLLRTGCSDWGVGR